MGAIMPALSYSQLSLLQHRPHPGIYSTMPPQIFKNRVIATAGPLPGQLSAENLKRWTENRRGRFSEDMDEYVTHLLCTREQFRKKVPRVRQALSQKRKSLHIVHCDWFEESTVHNRRFPEADYSMLRREAERRAAQREERRIEIGKANGEKFVNTNYYHIYRDREFFPYQIELIQYDQETGGPAYKYTLCLWESNAKPHLHWFTAKLLDKNPGKANIPRYHRGSAHAVKWRQAFHQFSCTFEKLCKIPWEDRVSMQGMVPTAFHYLPPGGGKPVGRRLRHPHDYCLEINASLRGLPWPPAKHAEQDCVAANDDAKEIFDEERIDEDLEEHGSPEVRNLPRPDSGGIVAGDEAEDAKIETSTNADDVVEQETTKNTFEEFIGSGEGVRCKGRMTADEDSVVELSGSVEGMDEAE